MTETARDEVPAWKARFFEELERDKKLQLARLGLPEHALFALSTSQPTPALKKIEDPFGILVLSGTPGTGKTVAAVAWIAEFVNDTANWTEPGTAPRLKSRPPVFTTASELARWDRYEQESMQQLLRAPRLAIDDVGAEYLDRNGFYASLLDEVINVRYSARLPVLLTTNILSAEEFRNRYGDRIAGRIRESGRFSSCGGFDLRRSGGRAA